MDSLKILKTQDGSATLFSKIFGESYHNINGAVAEAVHIYANAAYKTKATSINILEFGYGTGLNAMITYKLLKNENKYVNYTGVDIQPLSSKLLIEIGYKKLLGLSTKEYSSFTESWNETLTITDNFLLTKIRCDILNFDTSNRFDLVFYDAFSHDIQPELWTKDLFDKVFSMLNDGARLFTYSSKGLVKRNLRDAGFFVKRLAGPPGKRHIIEAQKVL
ncbi:MAG TPA: tRNA (5-methylaminomethyl-2-thiouridine)(34)-methyltransferase MnmD [Bacteroidales bacterium]|nr:tRNA (5-methylaminomethyl-2-thiouridine)(34)-methyltransferase MnmD [Bacteroidales bacterium]